MDFEKAYQKFLEGTATQEEIDFVRAEMNKAKAVNDILDNVKPDEKIIKAEQEDVQKAVKKVKIKDTIKLFIIVFASLVVVAGIVLAAIFIPAYNNAQENLNVSEKQAKQMAIEYVINNDNNANADKIRIRDFEREFEYNGRAKKSHYVYVMEVYDGTDNVYVIEINAKTGDILVERD